MTRPSVAALLASICLWTCAQSDARELARQVQAGETLETLAILYYGDQALADSLRLHNQLRAAEVQAGSVLRIPVAVLHEVNAEDTWASLAESHWADASLAGELAALSDQGTPQLEPGRTIRLPGLIPYRIRAGESMASLSRRVYGGPQKALPLARLNRIDDPRRLRVGQIVSLPVLTLEPSEPAAAEPEPSPPPDRSPPRGEFSVAIARALDAYAAGDLSSALDQLEALRPEVVERGNQEEILLLLEHLTVLYVAYDRPSQACVSYRALMRAEPSWRWDPELISPKIIRMTRGC